MSNPALDLEQAQNVVPVVEPGTCKILLNTAIGTQAVLHLNQQVRLFTVDLVNTLEQAKVSSR